MNPWSTVEGVDDGWRREERVYCVLVGASQRERRRRDEVFPRSKAEEMEPWACVHFQGTQHPLRQSVAVEVVEVTKVLPLAAGLPL